MKGVSPIIATILLVAFTVAIAGIVSIWLQTFTRTSTQTVGDEATTELHCSYAGLSLSSMKYSSSTQNFSGFLENTGSVALGKISLQIFYNNASFNTIYLCLQGSTVRTCSLSNLSISAKEKYSFNVSAGGSNYEKIRAISNCTTANDEVTSSEVST